MELEVIHHKIYEIRGHKVMLDFDIATLYNVQTKALKQAVKRNKQRFPKDFMFELNDLEWGFLRSQTVTLEKGRGKYPKYLPFAFTEQGIAMLSGILNSEKAIQVNIAIMRAFVMIRQYALNYQELATKIAELEQTYNAQFLDIYDAIELLLHEKKIKQEIENRKPIGYKVKKEK